MNLVNNAFGIHEHALAVRNRRVELISQNIANVDTPNYKARDIDFKKIIAGTQGVKVMATTAKEISCMVTIHKCSQKIYPLSSRSYKRSFPLGP